MRSTTQMDSSNMPVETNGDESDDLGLYRAMLSDLKRIMKLWGKRQQRLHTDQPVYRQILITTDGTEMTLCIYGPGHEPAMKLEGVEKQYIFFAYVKEGVKFIAREVESTAELIRNKLSTDGSFLEEKFNISTNGTTCIYMKRKEEKDTNWTEVVFKIQDLAQYMKRIRDAQTFAGQTDDSSVENDLHRQPIAESSQPHSQRLPTYRQGTRFPRSGRGDYNYDESDKFQ